MATISFKKPTEKKPLPPPSVRVKAPGLHGPGAGRPCLLTDALIEEFEALLPVVAYVETAADLMGIHRYTWRLWIKEGRQEWNAIAKDPTYTVPTSRIMHLKFFAAYKRAFAEFKRRNLLAIQNSGQWQANMAILQRRCPEEWGDHAEEIKAIKKQVQEMAKEAEKNTASHTAPAALPVLEEDGE